MALPAVVVLQFIHVRCFIKKHTNSLGLAESSTPKLSKHLHQLEAFWQISLEQLGLSEN
jgi:hypothetical protein